MGVVHWAWLRVHVGVAAARHMIYNRYHIVEELKKSWSEDGGEIYSTQLLGR